LLRRIFEAKGDEVPWEWRKLHNEELRGYDWGGDMYRLLVGKPEGKRPLGRPRRTWVDNIRMILERWDGVMWTGLVWLRIGTGGELL
jgi:hypothetical protein